MRTGLIAVVACWILWACDALAGEVAQPAIDLVIDGRAAAVIVVPDDPLPVVNAAAEELRYHLERASGARLPVVRESAVTGTGPRVVLGGCRAVGESGILPASLAPNGFAIRCVGDRLFLAGDDSQGEPFWVQHGNRTRVGTLSAVYEFLERQLGVQWLWPGRLGEVIPLRRTVRATDWNQVGKPAFVHARWREGGPGIAGTAGWTAPEARSVYLQDQGKWLRRHRFALGVNMDITHAFTGHWKRFGATRPEFFNVLAEYYRAFGKAEARVRAYFAHWEAVSAAVTEEVFAAAVRQETPESESFALFHRIAPYLFTPVVMARGRELLAAAQVAADGDPAAGERVAFLDKGLRHAELTLAAQRAYLGYCQTGRIKGFRTAVEELDAFRKRIEPEGTANLGALRWMEEMTWQRDLLLPTAPPSLPGPLNRNLIRDGGFENGAGEWKQHIACGSCLLTVDSTQAFTGRQSARITCSKLRPADDQVKLRTRAWARWYRAVPVEPGKAYRLRVRVRSSNDFAGSVDVWAALGGKTGTLAAQSLNTEAQWRELSIDRIVPETSPLVIYLNLRSGTGTLWFDDVELTGAE